MTDMRATERILEHVSERADEVSEWLSRIEHGDPGALGNAITDVEKLRLDIHAVQLAITELRRRGDTLVRREDLRLVAAAAQHGKENAPLGAIDYATVDAALGRIANVLDGTL